MRELSMNEIEFVAGASEWGDNVLKYAGAGALLGSFGGPKGAAIGIIGGAIVGTIVTLAE
ncbi:hypothetical protein [Lysobacter sp. A289]